MVSRPSPLENSHGGHCTPAVIVAVGEFGRCVSEQAMIRLRAVDLPVSLITRTLYAERADAADCIVLWRTTDGETVDEPDQALGCLLDEVLHANALQQVRDAGAIVDTGNQIETVVFVVGECEDTCLGEVLEEVTSAVATLCCNTGQTVHFVPLIGVIRRDNGGDPFLP